MDQSSLRKLVIEEVFFNLAFERDVDFQDVCPQSTYLDLESGEIIWVYEEDEDAYVESGISKEENLEMRERIEAASDRYLEIPGLNHSDHHEILQEFLNSDWTDDEETWRKARDAYFGSIGGWKKSLKDERILYAFYDYRDRKTKKMADEFLREHGVDPEWK
jgi:hypothetical protein